MHNVRLITFFKKFKNLSHQVAAINELERLIDPELLKRDSEWITCFNCDDGINQPPFDG